MPLRVLLADENLAVQKLVGMTFNEEDVTFTITDNGLSALDIAIKQRPDLILADYKMEGLDIWTFIKKAKQKPDIASIPIVLLVDSTETHDPVYLQSIGVEAFLKKPIDTQELKERIKSLSLLSEPVDEETSEVSGQSELSQHFTSSDDDSDMIADLLGWSTPEDHPQAESSEAAPEEEKLERSDPEIQTEGPDEIQIDPIIQKSDLAPFEKQGEDSESAEVRAEATEEQTSDPDLFPFETGGFFSDEEAFRPILEETAQDTEENDLLQPPAYGESIVIPQHGDDILRTHQEPEIESPPFAFEENDPFAQTEEADSGEDLLKADPLDASLDLSEQSAPFATRPGESETEETKEEEILASPPPLTTLPEEPPTATQDQSQDPSDETAYPDLGDELIRKTVKETAERIVKAMLPGLVKSSLSHEMIAPIVEEVAWELIPPLAEAEIKKEIKRLQPEKEES